MKTRKEIPLINNEVDWEGIHFMSMEIDNSHDKYFTLTLHFPDGSYRKLFISYNALVPKGGFMKAR